MLFDDSIYSFSYTITPPAKSNHFEIESHATIICLFIEGLVYFFKGFDADHVAGLKIMILSRCLGLVSFYNGPRLSTTKFLDGVVTVDQRPVPDAKSQQCPENSETHYAN